MSDGAGRRPAPFFLLQITFTMRLHTGRADE